MGLGVRTERTAAVAQLVNISLRTSWGNLL
jgi:hypothetical protein